MVNIRFIYILSASLLLNTAEIAHALTVEPSSKITHVGLDTDSTARDHQVSVGEVTTRLGTHNVDDSTAMSFELDEFVVYGSPLMKEVIPVQKLSGEQLKNLSSFSVADAIRYFSGVQIKDYGGIGGLKTVNVRSMGDRKSTRLNSSH